MPRKMSGICAIWLVRFLRLKRKDGLSGTTGRSALDWGPNRNSPRTPGFWSLGWGWVTGTSVLAQSTPGGGTQSDLVELQLCPLRDTAVPSRAFRVGSFGVHLLGRPPRYPLLHLPGKTHKRQVEQSRVGGGKPPYDAADRGSFCHPGWEAGPRVAEVSIRARGLSSGLWAAVPGEAPWAGLGTCIAGSGRDRPFCTQGTNP